MPQTRPARRDQGLEREVAHRRPRGRGRAGHDIKRSLKHQILHQVLDQKRHTEVLDHISKIVADGSGK